MRMRAGSDQIAASYQPTGRCSVASVGRARAHKRRNRFLQMHEIDALSSTMRAICARYCAWAASRAALVDLTPWQGMACSRPAVREPSQASTWDIMPGGGERAIERGEDLLGAADQVGPHGREWKRDIEDSHPHAPPSAARAARAWASHSSGCNVGAT